MRTSLTEIKQIEHWLLQKGDAQDRLVTEARALTNSDIYENAQWQAKAYELIQFYGREKLREQIKAVEHQLFNEPKYRSFQERIRSIFKR